jgi:hypothetical protein
MAGSGDFATNVERGGHLNIRNATATGISPSVLVVNEGGVTNATGVTVDDGGGGTQTVTAAETNIGALNAVTSSGIIYEDS